MPSVRYLKPEITNSMENGKQPINPIVNNDGFCTLLDILDQPNSVAIGLTKREYFAAMAMQGLLSNSGHVQTFSGNNPNPVETYVAEISIKLADELLTALDELKKSE